VIDALRRLPRIELAIIALAIGVLTFIGLERQWNAERAHVEPDSYSTLDSASGGYRAWYELLEREGAHVARFEERAAFLDRSIHTLIWADPLPLDDRQTIPSESDVQALENWVRGGGRLVYLGHDDGAAAEGILKLPHSAPAGKHDTSYVAPWLSAAGVARYSGTNALRWTPGARNVDLADERGVLIVSYPFGKGKVVAVIDEPIFTNADIGRPDRARLAYALAAPQPGTAVAFNETIHGFSTPEHWWNVVPRPFAIAIWCALGVLLVAFAGAAQRLGPPLVPQPNEPNSAAFLDALAALFERGRAARKALSDAASSARRALARSLGFSDQLAPGAVARAIEAPEQRRIFLELERISASTSLDERHFVRGVALAQRLRKESSTHASRK